LPDHVSNHAGPLGARISLSLRLEVFHKEIRNVRSRFENLYEPLGLIPELHADRERLDPTKAACAGASADVLFVDGQVVTDVKPGLLVRSPDVCAQDGRVGLIQAVQRDIDLARAFFVLVSDG